MPLSPTAILRKLLPLWVLLFALNSHAADTPTQPPQADVAIEALAMRIHGPSRQLRISNDGRVAYEHRDYTHRLNVRAELLLPPAQIAALLNSEALNQLAPLPKGDGPRPVGMHMPEFSIHLQTSSGKRHIALYDPSTLPPSAELAQSWTAWKAIWAVLPQWQQVANGRDDLFPTRRDTAPQP